MDKKQTIQWVVTAIIRGLAFVVAAKFGKDAISDGTWTALGDGLIAVVIAGVSIYTSIKARKTLLATPAPETPAK